MSEVKLAVMSKRFPMEISCGEKAIDDLSKNAYDMTVFKQALAYDILVDGRLVGSCMIRFASIEDEEYYVGDQTYTAIEIVYIAVDKRLQFQGIGKQVLKMLIKRARDISRELPVRFLMLNAFKDKEEWYTHNGFREYKRANEDPRFLGTVPMRMDFIERDEAESVSVQYGGL